MQLPESLRAAIEDEVDIVSTRDLTAAVTELSLRYREGHSRSATPALRSSLDVLAYAAYRLPATFAAVAAVLQEVRIRKPDLQPDHLLDVGGGPGTAAWAAAQIWPDLQRITVLERDARMIDLGRALAAGAPSPALEAAEWRHLDLSSSWEVEADVTVTAYLLGEISSSSREALIDRLWAATADTCVIVEPGTPRGFEQIRAVTGQLARLDAHIIAPFPARWTCVESGSDWCHFAQRVPRTRLHRLTKDAAMSFEDEKYTYVVASRTPGVPIAARVIRQPQILTGQVRLVLCSAQGVHRVTVTRSQREAFRRAKDLKWGSAIECDEAALFGLDTQSS